MQGRTRNSLKKQRKDRACKSSVRTAPLFRLEGVLSRQTEIGDRRQSFKRFWQPHSRPLDLEARSQASPFSGPQKGVITKGVFSLKESLEALNSLESLGNGRILLYFPQARGSLESLYALESQENGLSEKTPFPNKKFRTRPFIQRKMEHQEMDMFGVKMC